MIFWTAKQRGLQHLQEIVSCRCVDPFKMSHFLCHIRMPTKLPVGKVWIAMFVATMGQRAAVLLVAPLEFCLETVLWPI